VLLLEPNPLTQRIVASSLEATVGAIEAVADVDALLAALATAGRTHMIVQANVAGDRLDDIVAAAKGMRMVLLFSSEDGVDEEGLAARGTILVRKPVAGDALAAALLGEGTRAAA
jgi:hypothetical protein